VCVPVFKHFVTGKGGIRLVSSLITKEMLMKEMVLAQL
jgi:hypothetical protein